MGEPDREHVKWLVLSLLVVILIGLTIVQVEPDSSKGTLRVVTIDPGLTERTPQVDAIGISGSGESSISAGGKLAHEGDIINGFRILKIYPDRVEFKKNGKIVVGTINTRTSTRPKSNDLLQQPVSSEQISYKSSDNYYRQYNPPAYSKPLVSELTGPSQWEVFEMTTIKDRVRHINKGTIFRTASGNIYEVAELVFLFEFEYRPDVTILTDGRFYNLFIEGVDKPLLCKKLNRGSSDISSGGNVIEATIVNEFDGLEYEKIFKLSNGQVWEQTDFYIYIYIAVMPRVTIWWNGSVYKMKVEGIDKAVTVQQVR